MEKLVTGLSIWSSVALFLGIRNYLKKKVVLVHYQVNKQTGEIREVTSFPNSKQKIIRTNLEKDEIPEEVLEFSREVSKHIDNWEKEQDSSARCSSLEDNLEPQGYISLLDKFPNAKEGDYFLIVETENIVVKTSKGWKLNSIPEDMFLSNLPKDIDDVEKTFRLLQKEARERLVIDWIIRGENCEKAE